MFSLARRKTTQQQPAPQMHFGYRQIPTTTYVVNKPVSPVQQQENLPKMKWGRPIWTFFHVMAQKVKPEYFNLVIQDFLKNVLLVCATLPCPICSTHASEYMRSINMNNIRTKDDLINLFFNFHNVVNQRKGYAVLQKDQIPKYETANTIAAIKSFVYAFEDKSRSIKLMADDIARARISSQFKFWINSNIQYFEP
jgi:hypothetical protein